MAKMGRPKKDIKKEKVISLRLTDEIYQMAACVYLRFRPNKDRGYPSGIGKRIIQSEMSAGSLLVNNERRPTYGKST